MTHSLPFTFTARLAGQEREFDLELWFDAVPGLRATLTDPEAPERIELVDAVIRIGSTDHECPPWLWTMIEQSPVAQSAMAEAARREREQIVTAKVIITKLGGLSAVARGLGHRNVSTVQGWWERGVIPAHRQREVLELAERVGCDIRPMDVIPPSSKARRRNRA